MHVAMVFKELNWRAYFKDSSLNWNIFKFACAVIADKHYKLLSKKILRIRHHCKHSIVSVKKIVLEVHLKQHLITEEYALCRRTLSKNTALQS